MRSKISSSVGRGKTWQRKPPTQKASIFDVSRSNCDFDSPTLYEKGSHKILYDETLFQLDLILSSPLIHVKQSAALSLLQTLLEHQQQSVVVSKVRRLKDLSSTNSLFADSLIIEKIVEILSPHCILSWELLQAILLILLVFLSNFLVEYQRRNVELDADREEVDKEEEEEYAELRRNSEKPRLDSSILQLELLERLFQIYNHLLQQQYRSPPQSAISSPIKAVVMSSPMPTAPSRLRRKYASPSASSPLVKQATAVSSAIADTLISLDNKTWRDVWEPLHSRLFSGTKLSDEVQTLELFILFYSHVLQLLVEQSSANSKVSKSMVNEKPSLDESLSKASSDMIPVRKIQELVTPASSSSSEGNAFLHKTISLVIEKVHNLSARVQRNGAVDWALYQYEYQSISRSLEMLDLAVYGCSPTQDAITLFVNNHEISLLQALFELMQSLAPLALTSFKEEKVASDRVAAQLLSKPQTFENPFLECLLPQTLHSEYIPQDMLCHSVKLAVSLTNGSEPAVDQIVNIDESLNWLLAFLYVLLTWKTSFRRDDGNVSSERTRSMTELILLLVTLLINIIEEVNNLQSLTKHYFFGELSSWLKKFDIINALQTFPSLGNHLSDELWPKKTCSIYSLVVGLILCETDFFMNDLLAYELESEPVGRPKEKTKDFNATQNEEVAVCEILTSAHLILLLRVLIFGKFTKTELLKLPEPHSNRFQDELLYPSLLSLVANQLPHNDFWLFLRVLKAHIALQGQCGILNYDSYLPSLVALAHFEKLNETAKLQRIPQSSLQDHEDELVKKLLNARETHHEGREKIDRAAHLEGGKKIFPHELEKRPPADSNKALDWLFEENSAPSIKRSFSLKSSYVSNSRSSSQSTSYDLEIRYEKSDQNFPAELSVTPSMHNNGFTGDKFASTQQVNELQTHRGLKRKFSNQPKAFHKGESWEE